MATNKSRKKQRQAKPSNTESTEKPGGEVAEPKLSKKVGGDGDGDGDERSHDAEDKDDDVKDHPGEEEEEDNPLSGSGADGIEDDEDAENAKGMQSDSENDVSDREDGEQRVPSEKKDGEEDKDDGEDEDGSKSDDDENDDDEAMKEEDGPSDSETDFKTKVRKMEPKSAAKEQGVEESGEDRQDAGRKKKRKVHKLSMEETEDYNAKLKKRGVVYIARVPPRMTPTKLKMLLSGYGADVTRIYLVPEDPSKRKRRRQLSANGQAKSKRYVEGWIEFSKKRVAKHIARSLNNTPITQHKRNVHYGDLWNLKYLNKFKWSHLTEKVAYERRVREQRLRLETMQAQRETAMYKQMVETGKKIDKIEERLERKRKREEAKGKSQGIGDKGKTNVDSDKGKRAKHRKKQIQPTNDGADRSAKTALLGSLV